MASAPAGGEGADAGIGTLRSYYATPIELRHLPWALDFTPDNSGAEPFPFDYMINPYQDDPPLEWTTEDWDPALRFWTLPYDPHLTEWLRAANRSAPSTLAALEFGGQPEKWHPAHRDPAFDPVARRWLEAKDLEWRPPATGFARIQPELEQLKVYMQDDRARYLAECDVQADGLPAYMVHFIGADAIRHPWTMELINCVLAIGNVAYMSYKAYYKRVRPSVLMPGLTVPFGPPGHPAFPSGHAFLAHLLALMLLEIQGINQRFGVLRDRPNSNPPAPVNWKLGQVLRKPVWADLNGTEPIASPLLILARRIAVNRERIGVHYPSDSMAGRHLAAGIWDAMVTRPLGNPAAMPIEVPTLLRVLDHARTEWPTPWPALPQE